MTRHLCGNITAFARSRPERTLNFIHDDFLLQSSIARRLYHGYAANEPILDFHSHLSDAEIANNRRFGNLTEIWLEGDHYKWRAMRANGIDEHYCSGNAPPYEKFQAWARTVPCTLRNPLYHWTHLELKRYFGIDDLLGERTAESVWERANRLLSTDELTTQGILKKFRVQIEYTSNDPCDDLACHQRINSAQLSFRIYPTFRPDHALQVHHPRQFNAWVERLELASGVAVKDFASFLDALKQRHDFFHAQGARLSDHGLERCYAADCTERQANQIFQNARGGTPATPEESELFTSFLMVFFGVLDARRGWVKQLHLGALRSADSARCSRLGADAGLDCVGDWPQMRSLCAYLDALQKENALPRLILYNLNPADNYAFATAAGCFQDGSVAGKIQFGSAWWFLDQKEGIEWQLNALSATGLLARFVGMVTDSRSFMSFPRHEYFRRVLCNLIGKDVEKGELPNDEQLLGGMIRRICYQNAREFLGLEVLPDAKTPGA